MSATFATLPLEIRREIYSYLLLEENVTVFDKTRQTPRARYGMSLFTLNRQLSAESLEYFYAANAFVIVDVGIPGLMYHCSRSFPVSLSRLENFKHYALRLAFRVYDEQGAPCTTSVFTAIGSSSPVQAFNTVGVFAARHLSTFVQAVNAEQVAALQTSYYYYTEIDLTFRTAQQYLRNSPRILNMVVNSVKGLRQRKNIWLDSPAPWPASLLAPPPPPATPLRITFRGDLDDSQITDIAQATNPPDWTLRQLWMYMEAAKARGDAYSARTQDLAAICKARCEYAVAWTYLGYINEFALERQFHLGSDDDRYRCRYNLLMTRLCIDLSLCGVQLGSAADAFHFASYVASQAQITWLFPALTMREQARYMFVLALKMGASRKYEKAIGHVQAALVEWGMNESFMRCLGRVLVMLCDCVESRLDEGVTIHAERYGSARWAFPRLLELRIMWVEFYGPEDAGE